MDERMNSMRILMLGNSFTYYHDLPKLLSVLLNAQATGNTKGSAYLHEQLDAESDLGRAALQYLTEEKWDYVVLQEQSKAPIFEREDFSDSVAKLCSLIRQNGAVPVLYASWAYEDGSDRLQATGLSQQEMARGLYESYHSAAEANGALVADVGQAFMALKDQLSLYVDDHYHPSEVGSLLAAHVIAQTIQQAR